MSLVTYHYQLSTAHIVSSPALLDLIITAAEAGTRLDAFLAERIEGWSRSRLQRLIEDGDVLVNDKQAKPSYKLRAGDEIDIDLTEPADVRFEPENIPLDIVYEDEYLAVINKPAGMVVHPGAGISGGTLANAIAWYFMSEPTAVAGGLGSGAAYVQPPPTGGGSDKTPPADAGGSNRVGIVHRLDKDTSGLIVVAKTEEMQEKLSELFRKRKVEKSYIALVHGSPRDNSGTIERPIARDRWHRTKMTVAANGRYALTHWRVRQRFEKFALLEVDIKTGRTHQIRVHLASINHPVVGDAVYNEGRDNTIANIEIRKAVEKLGRFFLHAEKLSFAHPATAETLSLEVALPKELAAFINVL
ncbi:MAG: RluA family pseudouridine synthase [Acidobacteriota bacterium]|nr:MAG: RluA family pseudouridine synthase [Acidobacteriota bacterium]